MNLDNFKLNSQNTYSIHKKTVDKLRKVKPHQLDKLFHPMHEQVFSEIDCLHCANCCKTTSPIFLQPDIDRLARLFRMKSSEFVETYLRRDEEGDFVLLQAPCPFLGEDNRCFVYEERPKACREYPHTNRKNMYGILNLTLQNTLVCPAVFKIFQEISKEFRK
ncbi:YkgJ family cysteine cluster protein [Pararhodonellum marinum]|uniref:YkgJ family cysteine cluster protein n=1 Tax=Pararhodonellum marinum TaxID=2755358 RepID=UPI00188ED752|nr:YkgJ family cysteine cluster protein [Pararhodonellum marinum]